MSREQEAEQQVEPRVCSLGDHVLRDDEVTTCLRCINDGRRVLREVEELYAALPDAVATLTGISYDRSGPAHGEDPVPGGDALVMLGGGKFGGVTWGRPTRKDPEGSFEHLQDQWASDPPSVSAVLAELEDDWRHARGDGPAPYEPSVARCADYLRRHMTWAAQVHEPWVEQRALLGWLHVRLEVVTGTSTRPEPVGAPCMHCGGRIVRRWLPGSHGDDAVDGATRLGREHEGLADEMVCEGCGTTWRHPSSVAGELRAVTLPASYLLAQRAALEELPTTNPDLTVTLPEAKRILRGRVQPKTLEARVRRGMVSPVGADVRGAATYRLGDLAGLDTRDERACS